MIKNTNNKKKKKGFTLIELIIVIAIIAILAAIAIPKFGEVRKNAAFKSDVANAKTIANAVSTLVTENKLNDGTYYISSTEDDSADRVISGYLQNTPSPETKDYTLFEVEVENGDATVTMVSAKEGTSTKLFPVAAEEPTEVPAEEVND